MGRLKLSPPGSNLNDNTMPGAPRIGRERSRPMKSPYSIKHGAVVGSALALLLIASAFGGRAWAIIGGAPDGTRHPCAGAVIIDFPGYGPIPYGSCVLVHPRVAITAGHVAAMAAWSGLPCLGVSFAPKLDLTDPKCIPLMRIYPIPAHTGCANPNQYDIGLLIFEKPVKGITPAKVPYEGFLDDLKDAGLLQEGPDGTRFTAVGYGWTLEFPPPEPGWDPNNAFRNVAYPRYLGMNDGWLITHQNLASGDSGVARGDSGGPFFWTDPASGEETLVSITCWGSPQFVANAFSLRIDTYYPLLLIQWATEVFPVP